MSARAWAYSLAASLILWAAIAAAVLTILRETL